MTSIYAVTIPYEALLEISIRTAAKESRGSLSETEVFFKEKALLRGVDFCLLWTISDLSLTLPEYP